ncbi:hydrogenase 4 subunit D [Denitrobacterium detoxificans]|uniref:Hydrogenase-4 component D n=1 Tax=Denitrobacterium detoxificans TaxID=79604 RepID=A0A172RVW9_9ACTN|nr:hydrogenase 4 subunit D [Denitrobacterium detoxificans]ANE21881.1 hydrogenase 4 subunit D [Denitrobacterium detoxificans]SEO44130.1 hydrogenase-4 component D [Denitrobacterium detoxificans]
MTLFASASILVPFVCALLTIISPRHADKGICITGATLASLATLVVGAQFVGGGMEPVTVTWLSFGTVPIMGFVFDKVSCLLAPTFVIIGLLVTIYSTAYMAPTNREHPDKPRRRFYAFLIIFIAAMAGLVYSSTIIGQLVFFEVTGACSWALIGYYDTEVARASAMKALIVTHIGSLGLYLATAILFAQTGSFELAAIGTLAKGPKTFVMLAILFAAWGKSAQVPFYMWLPSAMNAPTPVSAYLHGASMVKVGVCVFARALICAGTVSEVVGWVVVIGGIVTCVFAFLMYLPQDDMKRLLAFSTISQLSYIFLGFGFYIFGSGMAFDGAVMHIFNHAWAKTLFFLLAGAFSCTMGTRMLPQLRGVLKKRPILGIGFGVAALAIAGCPPMNAFFSKFYIFSGGFFTAANNGPLLFIVVIALIETVVCFMWFLKWMGSVMFGEPSEVVENSAPVPAAMKGVFIVLIIMTFCSGFFAAAWIG